MNDDDDNNLQYLTNKIFSDSVKKKKTLREKMIQLHECLNTALQIAEEQPDDDDDDDDSFIIRLIIGYTEEYNKIHFAYSIKFQEKFIKWLWIARERIAIKKYHTR